ncbi:MAG: pyrroloquinoline quinone biosynthesis peptide chaperone PqqD [Chloroflexi bacterium]|nr:pyrroloquinoline quinone biosynthesis peptide chaperone PqqD [Chloroflexota bacterium]
MEHSKRPFQIAGFLLEKLDDELILLHPTGLTLIQSNESGSMIWQLCDGQRTVADIIQLLSAAYPESKDEIAADVVTTLNQFAKHGAISWQ